MILLLVLMTAIVCLCPNPLAPESVRMREVVQVIVE